MSLKAELETWATALKAYDEEDFEKALDLFSRIADSSKILTNMGLIYATLGEHEAAVEQFNAATQLDQYLAVAYFQCGVSNFLLGRYDLSLRDFDEALLYLRNNQAINYEQLGLKFKLFSAEVLFNRGLSHIYMGRLDEGLKDMQEAVSEKATDEHNVIDDAIADRGEGYTVFSIPVGILYRPSENKLKNAKTKDYMGKAKLIATDSVDEAYTDFSGVTRKGRGFTGTGAPIDGPGLSRSQTAPSPRVPAADDPRRPSSLTRSRTALPVAERASPNASPGGAGLQRSATSVRPGAGAGTALGSGSGAELSPTRQQAGLTRGLSVRKVQSPPPAPIVPPPPPEKSGGPRLTEIYDDYGIGYTDEPPPPVPSLPTGQARVAAWARSNANPGATLSRAVSSRAPSAYGSSAASVRRKPTRRPTLGRGQSRSGMSSYEEDEEGYVSGEYDDGPFELTKIRIKIHYQDDVRGMTLTPDTPWEEFVQRVTQKFNKRLDGLTMKFKDEDGGKITLQDDSDFELAIETARELAKGKAEGKLEIWLVDT
ncbi:hypothetical protein DFH11DRAFT_1543505 [Phellopilus nigrolimitatus]|nr:hypothetical protein DFH11DRAFT_1543505 [Phellopilus nigrolimitatus]